MKVSKANKEDLPKILALQKASYWVEAELYQDFKIPPLTQTLDSILVDYETGKILKIESDGKIIGSVRGFADGGTCKIGRLIVDKTFQNKGLGTLLMKEIESLFNTANRFELFTGHKSEKNLSLYLKLGYKEFTRQCVNEKLELVFLEKTA